MVVYFTPERPAVGPHGGAEGVRACRAERHPEPIVKSDLASDAVGDVRFRIDHADDKDIALLTECLNKQPGVVGVDIPDLTD